MAGANNSKTAVLAAIAGNGMLTVLKFAAAALTQSASMMNEAVHSLMDALNQVFLLLGLVQGAQPPDRTHACGHGQKKYRWNLWGAIGLFAIGAGLGLAHAWHALHNPAAVDWSAQVEVLGAELSLLWVSALVLGVALVVEGAVLAVAAREYLRRARAAGCGAFAYLGRSTDPTLVAVLLEDAVAVLGVLFAAAGIGLSAATGDSIYDVIFSALIALMLGAVSFFLGAINMRFLTDIRDPGAERALREILQAHAGVESCHDLRSVVVDESNTVVVAEIELSEEALAHGLRERIAEIKKEILAGGGEGEGGRRGYAELRAPVQATLERAEEVIDEVERRLRAVCPRVAHVTMEVEGIARPCNNTANSNPNRKGETNSC